MGTAVARIPAWQRRVSIVLVPAMVLAAVYLRRYLSGGPRMGTAGLGVGAPVTVGEEFHVGIPLYATGGPVELLAIRPVGVSGAVVVDVRIVLVIRRGLQFGTVRGPLTEADGAILLPPSSTKGLTISLKQREPIYNVDVRMIPTKPGVSRVAGVEVTYRAGLLRQRTARLGGGVCLEASDNWRAHVDYTRAPC